VIGDRWSPLKKNADQSDHEERMKRVVIIGSVIIASIIQHPASIIAAAEQLFVGTAKLDLVPPVKTPLAGYSRRKGKLATDIHDPLFVRAVVIQDENSTVALASCDLLIIDELLFDAVTGRLNSQKLPRPLHLLAASTHTHSGPGAYGKKFMEKLSMGHFDPIVFEYLATRITQAIMAASTHLEPATVSYATTSTTGLVVNRMDPEGIVDAELVVLTFADQHQKPMAVVVNFSAHPTTLGAWNRQFSADYPGVLTRMIEERYPQAVCLFFAGAVGDQAPVKHGNLPASLPEGQAGDFEPAQRIGRELANSVFMVLGPLDVRPTGLGQSGHDLGSSISVVQRTLRLPPARLRIGGFQLPSWISQSFVDDDAMVTVIAIGPVMILGFPCDMSTELGLELKSHATRRGYQPFLVGFANDYIGYCLPERLYWTDSYEASLAFNGPKAGEVLVEELKRMIDQLGER